MSSGAAAFPDSITAAQLRELLRAGRQKRAAIAYEAFEDADRDTIERELNGLYSYEERTDFAKIRAQFDQLFPEKTWKNASDRTRREFVMTCLDKLDTVVGDSHQQWAVCLLYIAQGVHGESKTSEDLLESVKRNAGILRKYGTVPAVVEALHQTVALGDAWPLVAVYLQILTIIMIVHGDDPRLAEELAHPQRLGQTFVVLLFDMLNCLADGRIPRSMPLQKLMTCLRHALLICWGNSKKLEDLKAATRAQAGLPPVKPGVYAKQTMEDLELFERDTVSRYYGMQPIKPGGGHTLEDLEETLPIPILEGLRTLRANVYVPLGEVQIKQFLKEKLPIWPWSPSTIKQPPNATELLSHVKTIRNDILAIMPNLSRNVVTLLKLLLASVPSPKKTPGATSLLSDYDLVSRTSATVDLSAIELSAQQVVDVARHRETLTMAISSVFILLLKHMRVVHVLYFELLSHLFVDNNCILLLLRFFNQDMSLHLSTKNEIPPFSFLAYTVNPREQLEDQDFAQAGKSEQEINGMDGTETQPIHVSWRNTHATINMMRVLQKLTKRKAGRIRTMMEFKAPAILKRSAKLTHDRLAFYTLKVFKSLLPYLGRKWRSSNMKIVSAVYLDLRSRSSDAALLSVNSDLDGEELPQPGTDEIQPLIEEFLRTLGMSDLNESSSRMGGDGLGEGENDDEDDQDHHLLSLSLRNIDLGLGFQQNYSAWLEAEVYGADGEDEDEQSGLRARPTSPQHTT